jgi:hypothetical protein
MKHDTKLTNRRLASQRQPLRRRLRYPNKAKKNIGKTFDNVLSNGRRASRRRNKMQDCEDNPKECHMTRKLKTNAKRRDAGSEFQNKEREASGLHST